jgi:hypothetical protein
MGGKRARTATSYLIGKLAAGSGEVSSSVGGPTATQAPARQLPAPGSQAIACGPAAGTASFQNLLFESDAFGIIFLKPFFRGVSGGEDLDVLGVANLLARVDVDKTAIGLSSACTCPNDDFCTRH